MTAGELLQAIAKVPDDREVLVRCEWEGDDPAGTVFRIAAVTPAEMGCDTAVEFVALECDQAFDENPEEPEI